MNYDRFNSQTQDIFWIQTIFRKDDLWLLNFFVSGRHKSGKATPPTTPQTLLTQTPKYKTGCKFFWEFFIFLCRFILHEYCS